MGTQQLPGAPVSALRALPLLCVPSADGPCVPVPPSEGYAGADTARGAPRSPGFPSAEERCLPQQRRGPVSTWPGGVVLGGGRTPGVGTSQRGSLQAWPQDMEPSGPSATLGGGSTVHPVPTSAQMVLVGGAWKLAQAGCWSRLWWSPELIPQRDTGASDGPEVSGSRPSPPSACAHLPSHAGASASAHSLPVEKLPVSTSVPTAFC